MLRVEILQLVKNELQHIKGRNSLNAKIWFVVVFHYVDVTYLVCIQAVFISERSLLLVSRAQRPFGENS